ncbi:hypothetical protein [Brucella gallinifaecis]|uniref:hypothetical protein n=1 Tax=Brucella gallinifaecis TaxID=215590 RepID=UPI00235F34B9|nr:hypothetical protein [Brucella gallinifaecis]
MNWQPQKKPEFGRAETIAERKARLAYDRENPWQPIIRAKLDGSVCELQFCDMVGNFNGGRNRYVFTVYPRYNWKRWLCVNKPGWAPFDPCGFRMTDEILTNEEIAALRRKAGA